MRIHVCLAGFVAAKQQNNTPMAVELHYSYPPLSQPPNSPRTQSRMEFWPALLASRAGFDAFRGQQPDVYKQLLDNLVNGMALASTEALATDLHTLYW
jgi:hypothetical protein